MVCVTVVLVGVVTFLVVAVGVSMVHLPRVPDRELREVVPG